MDISVVIIKPALAIKLLVSHQRPRQAHAERERRLFHISLLLA